MNKHAFRLCCLVWLIWLCSGGNSASAQTLSTHASRLLGQTSAQLSAGSRVKFQLQLFSRNNKKELEQSGDMVMLGKSFRLTFSPYDVAYDESQLSYYDRDEHTFVTLSPQAEEMVAMNPLVILAGYRAYYNAGSVEDGKETIVTMIPKKTSRTIEQVALHYKRDATLPYQVVLTLTGGAKSIVHIQEVKPDRGLDMHMFKQKRSDYPGAEWVDLR